MAFDGLLGNEQLKSRISAMLRQDKFPHCVLISGPQGSGKHTLARMLCAALVCTEGKGYPCGVCPQCRKALAGQHPDIVTVDDPEKKSLPIELLRKVCTDVYIRPNESRRKIYLFHDADKLVSTSAPQNQNTLLKVLEEPPAYAVFLLLSSNPGLLLPTIRSRCATLNMRPLPQQVLHEALRARCPDHTEADYRRAAASGYLGAAMQQLEPPADETAEFLAAFAARDRLALLLLLTPLERQGRERILALLREWQTLLTAALCARSGGQLPPPAVQAVCDRRTAKEIMQAIEHLRAAEQYCGANVNSGALCGALAVKLAQ
ncbi:MAG: AAA family ATPase [Oscillospiraceae bacterium]|nr:AAA family ATPase [Oscillospiraceae bacterium]